MQGINDLANTVKLTMGPQGSTVIITDNNGIPYITKDGFSVSRDIVFTNPIKNIAANLFKEVAKNTVDEAGDGTTTATVLAQSLIQRGFAIMNTEDISYTKIKEELEDLEGYVLKGLNNHSKKIKPRDIRFVATIAANGDNFMGSIIDSAYSKANIVKVEESDNEIDSLEVINGMQLDTGFFDKALINNPSKQSIEYKNIPLVIIDGHLTDLQNIAALLQENKDGIAIIADHFSDEVVSIIRENYNRGRLKIALIKSPGFATHRKDLLSDLAVFTDSEVIDPSKSIIGKHFGIINSLVVTQNKTIITRDIYTPQTQKRAEDLKNSLQDLNKTQKKLTQERIDNLSGSIAIIKTGGSSEIEMKERKDRYDDAVLAVSCAIEEGIIQGGGKVLQLLSITTDNMFKSCLLTPKQTIIENGAVIDYTKDFIKEGIIDPVKVTRVAFKNAISIAKTILSVKAVVQNNQRWT
jgi:chaperonin GroEL